MTIGEFSIGLSIIGTVPYIAKVVRGNVRPHRTSWFIWTIMLALTLWGYRAAGADDSAWFIFGDLLVTATIFVLSLWCGKGGYGRLDVVCLGVALVSMLVWQIVDQPVVILIGTMLADIVGVIPTVRGALDEPDTENAWPFLFSTLAAFCGIAAVGQWDTLLLFYPFYLFLANFVTALVVMVGQYQYARLCVTHE